MSLIVSSWGDTSQEDTIILEGGGINSKWWGKQLRKPIASSSKQADLELLKFQMYFLFVDRKKPSSNQKCGMARKPKRIRD
ncbi:hypothetical protein M2119_000812 [Aurantimicrobium minutum]|nr:hypothetical protein [Aurantimicrobium minutum]